MRWIYRQIIALASASSVAALCIGSSLTMSDAMAQSPQPPEIAAVCAPCHGLDGIGHDVEVPNIGGQHSIYLRNQLIAFRKGSRKHSEMRFMARDLTDREIDQLVVYYSNVPPR